jgi:clan AA aspartic protease
MITGRVNASEGRLRLKVKGSRRREQEVEAVIDTGYTSSLCLPPALVGALGLLWRTTQRAILADGSEVVVDVYQAKVVWDGKERRILVDEVDAGSLGGMRLLRGYELKMQIRSRGKVTIKRLPRR